VYQTVRSWLLLQGRYYSKPSEFKSFRLRLLLIQLISPDLASVAISAEFIEGFAPACINTQQAYKWNESLEASIKFVSV